MELQNKMTGNRSILKNTVLLYIRQIFTLLLSLYSSRLTLQVLGETDLGIYATVAGFTGLVFTFTASLATGTQRFITFELRRGDLEQLNRVYCTSINIHIALSLLLIIIGEVAGSWFIFYKLSIPEERLWTAFGVFQLTILSTVLVLLNAPNNAVIIAHEDMGTFGLFSIMDAVLKCAGIFCLSYITWNRLLVYAFLLSGIQFLNRTICLIWCKKKYKEVRYRFIYDKRLIKEMLSVTGWTGLNNIAIIGFIQGVNLLLNVFFGPALNAAYTLATQAYSGIRQFCSSFQLASNPQITKLYASGELKKMNSLIFSVCRMSFYLIFTLSLPFIMNAHYIMELWLTEVPKHTTQFFIILLIYAYLEVLAYPLDVAAQATGKLKWYSIRISLATLSVLVFSYVAFSFEAIPETVYIIAITVSFMTLFIRLFSLRSLIDIDIMSFIKDVIFRFIKVAGLSLIVSMLLHYYVSQIIINFIISYISTIAIVYFIGLSSDEKKLVKDIANGIKKKFAK